MTGTAHSGESPLRASNTRLATVAPTTPAATEIASSIIHLAERFRPSEAADLDARWTIRVEDAGAYTIHVRRGRCFVSVGSHPEPDATIETDAETWLHLTTGRQDGVAAFARGRLRARGDLNLALRLDSLFTPGPEATRLLRTTRTQARGTAVEAFVAGSGTPVLLLHGLAASKVSFLPTVDGLADRFEVHALDLPGFGRSEKPLPSGRRYHPRWMADTVAAYMRGNGIRQAYVVGNSMGGRVAVELALREPRLVRGVVGLGAAVAFDEWQWAGPFLRRLQSHWVGLAPVPLRRSWVSAAITDLFADPGCVPPENIDAAVEEFLRGLRDPRHRLAIAACARHLAGERATGRRSFWTRLERLQVRSLWIWGAHDRLSSSRYAERVLAHAPGAEVEVWDDVGHVPQFEEPERTNARILEFLTESAED